MAGFTPGLKPNLFNAGGISPMFILLDDSIEPLLEQNRFAWINPEIPKDFKTYKVDRSRGAWEYNLIKIDKACSVQEATEACTYRGGWFPGKLEHLLAYSRSGLSVDNPNKEKPVISLGSLQAFKPHPFIPASFYSEGTGKVLDLFEEKDFVAGCRFLSVRPSPLLR